MSNVETFPSKQMYLELSLVERKESEFYHNIDKRRYWFGSNDLFSSLCPDNWWCPYSHMFFLVVKPQKGI